MTKSKDFKRTRTFIKRERAKMEKFKAGHPRAWNKFRAIRDSGKNPTKKEFEDIVRGEYFTVQSARVYWSKFKQLTRFEEATDDRGKEEITEKEKKRDDLKKQFAKMIFDGRLPDLAEFRKLSDTVMRGEGFAERQLMTTKNVMTSFKIFMNEKKGEDVPEQMFVTKKNVITSYRKFLEKQKTENLSDLPQNLFNNESDEILVQTLDENIECYEAEVGGRENGEECVVDQTNADKEGLLQFEINQNKDLLEEMRIDLKEKMEDPKNERKGEDILEHMIVAKENGITSYSRFSEKQKTENLSDSSQNVFNNESDQVQILDENMKCYEAEVGDTENGEECVVDQTNVDKEGVLQFEINQNKDLLEEMRIDLKEKMEDSKNERKGEDILEHMIVTEENFITSYSRFSEKQKTENLSDLSQNVFNIESDEESVQILDENMEYYKAEVGDRDKGNKYVVDQTLLENEGSVELEIIENDDLPEEMNSATSIIAREDAKARIPKNSRGIWNNQDVGFKIGNANKNQEPVILMKVNGVFKKVKYSSPADIDSCCLPMLNTRFDCYGITAINMIFSLKTIRHKIKNVKNMTKIENMDQRQLMEILSILFNRRERNFVRVREFFGLSKDEPEDASSVVEKILDLLPVRCSHFTYLLKKVCTGQCQIQHSSTTISNFFNRLVLRENGRLKDLERMWKSDSRDDTCRCGGRIQHTKVPKTRGMQPYHVIMIDHVHPRRHFIRSNANDVVAMFGKSWRLVAFSEHFEGEIGHYVSWMRIDQDSDDSNWVKVNDHRTSQKFGCKVQLDEKSVNVLVLKQI